MKIYKLPTGHTTESIAEYAEAWVRLREAAERAFQSYKVLGYDPGLLLHRRDGHGDSFNLPADAAIELAADKPLGCLARWVEGLLSRPGEPDKPSGFCVLPANHGGDYHVFPNNNRQPITHPQSQCPSSGCGRCRELTGDS